MAFLDAESPKAGCPKKPLVAPVVIREMTDSPTPALAAAKRQSWLSLRGWYMSGCLAVMFLASVWFWYASRPDLAMTTERGWQAYLEHDMDTVQRQMTIAERLDKNSGAARLLRGAFLLSTKDPELALKPLLDASQYPVLRPRALLLAARAYLDLHQFRAAEQLLSDCVREDPDAVEAHRLYAAMYYDLGANPLVIEHLEAVSRLDPTDARPLRVIGLMRKDFQDYTAAAAAYRAALNRPIDAPLAAEVRLELAQCLAELRKYEESLAALQPTDQMPEAIAVRMLCFRTLGRMDEARQQAELAREISDPPLSLTLELGNYWDAAGDLKQATLFFERAVQQDRLDFVPRYKLSTIYARQGRTADAAEQVRQMQKNRERYDRLHALQNQAMREPYNAAVRYEMGVAALALDRTEMARVWFTAAIGLDPEHHAARAALQALESRSTTPFEK
ncbi:MAG: tetratricopeptide repeat protein [Planctomycetaceae bacterium]|nr:tetratricopeptide repeat protein [Planctomycetaceae bacterium]